MSIPVFVISLKSASDRMARTLRQLNDEAIQFEIIEAVDGRTLAEENFRDNPDFGIFKSGFYSRFLRKEEIGCTLSHMSILKRMVAENITAACILEDDNVYCRGFKEILSSFESTILTADLIYLGHRSECTTSEAMGRKMKLLEHPGYFIGEPLEMPYGSHGYIITNSVALRLLENAYPVRVPYDVYLGNSTALGIRILLLQPPCIVSDPKFNSTIQDEQTIIVRSPLTSAIRDLIRKNRTIFGILKNGTIKFRILRNSTFRFLRRNRIIRNRYARNSN
jgi:glycosyl transferase family 25